MRSIYHGLNGLTRSSPASASMLASLAIFYIALFSGAPPCEGFQTSTQIFTHRKSFLQLTPLPEHAEFINSFLPTISHTLATTSSVSANSNILESYGDLLRTYPLTTKSITAGVLSSTGDAIAQFTNKDRTSSYDVKRGLVFGLFGVAYTGVFQHYWFPYLTSHMAEWGHFMHIWGDSASPGGWFQDGCVVDAPPGNLALAAGKVVINQMVMIPGLYMPIFLILTSLLGGLDLEQAKSRAASLYFPLVRRNWLFWFPTQFIQFFAIPTEWHIPFLSTASLVWTIILSTIGAAAASSTSTPQQQPAVVEPTEEVVEEITGIDTIRVVDVVQNAVRRQVQGGEAEQSILGATTTVLLVLLLTETTDSLWETSMESAEEIQALVIATAGWIGWTLGPKFASTNSIENERPELAMARLPFESLQHKLAKSAVAEKESATKETVLAGDDRR